MGISNTKKTSPEPKTRSASIVSHICSGHRLLLHEDRTKAFCLTWLDNRAHDGSVESFNTQTLLRQINPDNCFFFDRPETFPSQIVTLASEYRKIVLVISGTLAEALIPQIHINVYAIIIFCHKASRYVPLQSLYSTVVDICTSHEELRSSILSELSSFVFRLFDNQTLRTVVPLNSSNGIANDCVHRSYISFIQLLKEMPRTEHAKEIMLSKCEDYCRGRNAERKVIERFRNDYQSNQAIDWYISSTFIYELTNRAFRTQDVSLWYIFRYFIADLCKEIERVHKEQNIRTALTLYRGQSRMHHSEFDCLRSNIGCLVSTIAFLSTSTRIEVATQFCFGAVDTDEYKVVLFQITVDGANLENTVFVDIERYNPETREAEVLFNIGSVFRIEDVSHYQTDPPVWLIKMTATDEGTHEIKENLEKKKQTFRSQHINLTFGRLLIDMHEYVKAESYFQVLIQNLSNTHPNLPFVHNQLGDLYMRSTHWQKALDQFTRASELQKNTCSSMLSVTWNNFGNYYKAVGDYDQALQYYTKAWQCPNKPSNRMRLQLNMAAIDSKYEEAIDSCVEAHLFFHQVDPRPDDEIVHSLGVMADIYIRQGEYKKAEDYYTTAMDMTEKVLLIGHGLRISVIKSLADLYVKQERKPLAIDLCQKKLFLYEQCLRANHPSIAHLSMKLAELYDNDDSRKITLLQGALTIFETNIHFDYAATSECLLRIAEYEVQHGMDQAYRYYYKALHIQKQIYPKDHSKVRETQAIIDAPSVSRAANPLSQPVSTDG